MSTAAIGMLVTSIIGGVIAIVVGLVAAYLKDRWHAVVSGLVILVTIGICWGCWIFLPHDYDQAKAVRQQYRERVWGAYKKCFSECQDRCHQEAEKTLDYWKEREAK